MNRIVVMKRPARLVVERLIRQKPDLSPRMNRLLQNYGRQVFRGQLQDLAQRLGIIWDEVNAAYTDPHFC